MTSPADTTPSPPAFSLIFGETTSPPKNESHANPTPTWARPGAESVRLVIWDLDETFWSGTLSEGGLVWRPENAAIVRALARRGIPSAICSRNDKAPVMRVLQDHGIDDFFVLADVDWDAKGPRLARVAAILQLRPETLLFIDDNPANLAEAASFVPGLQTAGPECLPGLLDHRLLQGKSDPEMTRLAQYRVLAQRAQAETASGGTENFLRSSGIRVEIVHDIESHLDRIIELINRTNQLNFTKSRLPEHPEQARAALHQLLAQHNVQAGLLRVHDNFGDHGYAGFYLLRAAPHPALVHFVFSCRILGMGVEAWLYRRLGRPQLRIVGDVRSDPISETRAIDWIADVPPGTATAAAAGPRPLTYILTRGGCDMRAVAHYCHGIAGTVIEESGLVRGSQLVFPNHAVLAVQAMDSFDAGGIADTEPLGFLPQDFSTRLVTGRPGGPGAWILGFSIERNMPLYRHKRTGLVVPFIPAGLNIPARAMMRGADGGVDPAIAAHLRDKFVLLGSPAQDELHRAFQRIFAHAPQDVRVFVMLSNTVAPSAQGGFRVLEEFVRHNALVAEAAAGFPNVELIDPRDFMTAQEAAALSAPHHFDRMVYYRFYQHVEKRIRRLDGPQ